MLKEAEHRSTFYIPYWNLPFAKNLVPRQRQFYSDLLVINDCLDDLIAQAKNTRQTDDAEALQARDYSKVICVVPCAACALCPCPMLCVACVLLYCSCVRLPLTFLLLASVCPLHHRSSSLPKQDRELQLLTVSPSWFLLTPHPSLPQDRRIMGAQLCLTH